MKRYLGILFCGFTLSSQAQPSIFAEYRDSLLTVFKNSSADSVRFNTAVDLSGYYRSNAWNFDAAVYYANEAVLIALKTNQQLALASSLIEKGRCVMELGDFASGLQRYQQVFEILNNPASEKKQDWIIWPSFNSKWNRRILLAYVHQMYGSLMQRTGDLEQHIYHCLEAARLATHSESQEVNVQHVNLAVSSFINAGRSYLKLNKPDSALFCITEAEKIPFSHDTSFIIRSRASLRGDIYMRTGEDSLALRAYHNGLGATLQDEGWRSSPSVFYFRLGNYYTSKGNKDSALYYFRRNMEAILTEAKIFRAENNLAEAYEYMYQCFESSGPHDSTFKYQRLALVTKDSLYKLQIKNLSAFQRKNLSEQLRLQNLEKDKAAFQNRIRTYALLIGLGVLLLIVSLLYRNNRQKQRSNSLLASQKQKVEVALAELKATQVQLIQSEKMASLGELTAGIAHEIQNPLNFVNNFSEVNEELLKELKAEAEKGNLNEVKAIAKDIEFNSEKINHHGKRADLIVKGMLQHSRASSGQKEPTDINALADEYLRLAYHGLRAKDKSFSADFKTEFDNTIGKINVVPQEIGRVILNLINNAFYAVSERQKAECLMPNAERYEPSVTVSTAKHNGRIEITIKDNGNGISQKVLDKIFQPFFTTKPTGEGTGLGLSLSYDIVKTHGGELKVETYEGKGSEFIVRLPGM